MLVFQPDVLRNTGRHTDHNTGGILGCHQTSQEMQCFQHVLGLPRGILLPNGHAMRCPVRPSSYISNTSTLSASKMMKLLPFSQRVSQVSLPLCSPPTIQQDPGCLNSSLVWLRPTFSEAEVNGTTSSAKSRCINPGHTKPDTFQTERKLTIKAIKRICDKDGDLDKIGRKDKKTPTHPPRNKTDC